VIKINQIVSILKSAKEIITFENVSFMLGLIGSAGTVWNLFQSRKKIEFIPIGFKLKDNNELIVHFEIINRSRIAISIVNISYMYSGTHYSCLKGCAIGESIYHERMQLKNLTDFYTQPPKEIHPDFSKPQTFQVSANRGMATEMKLLLTDPDSSSLHKFHIRTSIRSLFQKWFSSNHH
jgi:hypothetical protein